jgi:hypothetical protein
MSFFETAGSSLVGVIVGSGTTYFAQARLAKHREHREQVREERRDQSERTATAALVRMASRLVVLDVFRSVGQLRATRETGRWWTALTLADGSWRQHAELLGRELSDAPWGKVAGFFVVVEEWNALIHAARRYYWIKPRLHIRRDGLEEIRDALLESAPVVTDALRELALPDVADSDTFFAWVRGELDATSKGAPAR